MTPASFVIPPAAAQALSMMSSIGPMLHAPCRSVNAVCRASNHPPKMDEADVDETWARISRRVGELHRGKGREVAWLADRLGMKIQRVNNWKTRGVPASCLVDIAAAIGWSVNQVLGLSDPPALWPFETIDQARFARLTARQLAMVEIAALREIERIEGSSKRQESAA